MVCLLFYAYKGHFALDLYLRRILFLNLFIFLLFYRLFLNLLLFILAFHELFFLSFV